MAFNGIIDSSPAFIRYSASEAQSGDCYLQDFVFHILMVLWQDTRSRYLKAQWSKYIVDGPIPRALDTNEKHRTMYRRTDQ